MALGRFTLERMSRDHLEFAFPWLRELRPLNHSDLSYLSYKVLYSRIIFVLIQLIWAE